MGAKTKAKRWVAAAWMVAGLALSGCGGGGGSAGSGTDTDTDTDSGGPGDHVFLNGSCQVHGDCGPAHYCALGTCEQGCMVDEDCLGEETCSPHGLCLDADGNPVNPPNLTATGLALSETRTVVSDSATEATVTLRNDGNDTVRYRLSSPSGAVTLNDRPFELAAGDEVELAVELDPASLPAGSGFYPVVVLTDDSSLQWNIEAQPETSGFYVGSVSLGETGRFLGVSSLGLNLSFNDDQTVTGQTYADSSLLWPNDVVISGTWSEDGAFTAQIDDVLPAENPLGMDIENPLAREMGREIALVGTIDFDLGLVTGSLTETVTGLAGVTVEVPGSFELARGGAQREPSGTATDFSGDLPLFAPSAIFPADLDTEACDGLAVDYGTAEKLVAGGPVAACAACVGYACLPSEALACVDGLLEAGFALDDPNTLSTAALVGQGGQVEPPPVDVWASCIADGEPQYADGQTCVDRAAVRCAGALARYALQEDGGNSPQIYGPAALDAMKAEASMGTVLGLQKMVDAVFAYQEEALGDVANAELGHLQTALDLRQRPLVVATSPGFLDILDLVGKAELTGAREGADLETGLALSSQWADTLGMLMRVRARTSGQGSAELQAQAQYVAAWTNGIAAMWVSIADLYELDDAALEMNIFGDATAQMNAAFDRFKPGTNAFGFSDDYVPIVLTPEQAAMGVSNFTLVAEQAATSIAFYEDRLMNADAARQAFEQAAWDTAQEAQNIADRYDDELGALCGWDGDVPAYDDCGLSTGTIFEYDKERESADLAVEQAALALLNNDLSMEDEEWRWAQTLANFQNLEELIKQQNGRVTEILEMNNETRKAAKQSQADRECGRVQAAMREQKEILKLQCREEIITKMKPNPGYWFGPDDPAGAAVTKTRCLKQLDQLEADAERQCATIYDQVGVEATLDDINVDEEIELRSVNAEVDAAIRQSELNEKSTEHQLRVKELLRNGKSLVLESRQAAIASTAASARFLGGFDQMLALLQRRQKALQRLESSPANPLTNPKFLQTQLEYGRSLLRWREQAARAAYLAGRALEYHVNQDIAQIETELVSARSATEMEDFLQCMTVMFQGYTQQAGTPQQFVTEVSIRDDLLRFGFESVDEVTGDDIPPADRFRAFVTQSDHYLPDGSLEFPIGVSLTENSVFSSLACNDVIESIQIKVVGDYVGDNEVDFFLSRAGEGSLRRCDSPNLAPHDRLVRYGFGPRSALVQAGANDYGLAQPNGAFAGWPVGGDEWKVRIPSGEVSPANADMDLESVSDVVIKVTHRAGSVGGTVSPSCN